MFVIKDAVKPGDLGFVKKGCDYVAYINDIDGVKKVGFTIYMGSKYIRYSKTAYICDAQMKQIYEWTKNDLIEWAEDI